MHRTHDVSAGGLVVCSLWDSRGSSGQLSRSIINGHMVGWVVHRTDLWGLSCALFLVYFYAKSPSETYYVLSGAGGPQPPLPFGVCTTSGGRGGGVGGAEGCICRGCWKGEGVGGHGSPPIRTTGPISARTEHRQTNADRYTERTCHCHSKVRENSLVTQSDVVNTLRGLIDDHDVLFVALVPKSWGAASFDHPIATKAVTAEMWASRLTFSFSRNLRSRSFASNAAERLGNREVQRCAREIGCCPWILHTCHATAVSGHQGGLLWL